MDSYDALHAAIRSTDKFVSGLHTAQLDDPTPCTGWRVRDLLNHLLGTMTLGAALFTDSPPAHPLVAPGLMPEADLVGDAPASGYRDAAEQLLAAARSDGALERAHQSPLGELPGEVLAGIITLDVFVHGWDLTRATEQDAAFDEDLASRVLAFAQQAITADIRGAGLVGPVVPVAENAPTMDRLVGHMGRTP